ncbi:50S ribosomal protein L6 [Algimonas porphyrae]|uniref:Large ribosomal subunit protein uL6 n=1 Tax=Algimonas porphyrae TaxID=1128113 RepID=A0ABQ5V2E7_9PROT|nr:50S ribosomal protein L6 [Algimonas porphyrae]GLQ21716.1 50S ribosomal protein L6 [Algimonas porphyrae]
MSRIGKKPITVPSGVTLTQTGQSIAVKGPKGELSFTLPDAVTGEFKDNELTIDVVEGAKNGSAMWGMARTMVANMIEGVTDGFTKALELRGVGYRAQMKGSALSMQLGYSHDVDYTPPAGITIEAPKPTSVIVSGIDKQQVGQVAAEIRAFRKPEPYKGKGVRYVGEYVRQKEGKKK